MAKHDQRILKFLTQNADRAPTITEMMTRLNISISDISDSLGSLQAQGLIAKKTNSQGIECWFPSASPAAQPIPAAAVMSSGPQISDHLPPQAQATAQFAAIGSPIAESRSPVEVRSASFEPRFMGSQDRSMAAPEPQPPMPRAAERELQPRPVQVQHMATEPVYAGRGGVDSSARNEIPSLPQQPIMNGSAGMYGLAPARNGVGFLTLLAGLVAAVALSAFITTKLIAKEFSKASASFVDRKALVDANVALADFQERTKAHVTALEAQVKTLSDQLAASKAAVDSSKQVAAAAPAAPAGKAAPAAKAAPAGKAAKAEAKTAEAKPAKGKKALAATKPKAPVMSAIAKAAARGAAMRKKAAARAHEEPSEPAMPSEEGSSSSSGPSASEAPAVPNPPGLEELPPPPASE